MLASMRSRIFLMYTLLFTLILAAAVVSLGVYIARAVNEQTITGLDVFAENVGGQVEEQFRIMDRVSTRLLFSRNVLDIMGKIQAGYGGGRNYFSQNPEKLASIYRDFLVILGLDVSNTVITIYNEKAFVTTAQSSVDWNVIREDAENGILARVKTRIMDNPSQAVLLGPHGSYWDASSGQAYFSLSRRLFDVSSGRDLGVLQVLKKREDFEKLCGSPGGAIRIFLFNEALDILNAPAGLPPAENAPGEIQRDARQLLAKYGASPPAAGFKTAGPGRQYLVSIKTIAGGGYGILLMQPYHSGLALAYMGTVFMAVLLLTAVTLGLNFFVSRYLTRPLDQIIAALRQITASNLDMNIDFHSSTEDLRQLQQFYNAMLSRVREAMNQTLQSKLNEREAYYLALQSQISPHFLYNCISNISAIAYENDTPQIIEICEGLSNMTRYVMDFDKEQSVLKGELEYTRNYLDLMRIRYADNVIFTTGMDETCADYPVPRLMLQTVVENCFKHGFHGAPFPWLINITIFPEDAYWTAEVIDNGAGVDEEKINAIIAQSQARFEDALRGVEDPRLGGLGLLNSLTRLRLLYNNAVHFSVKSMYRGTMIRFGGKINAGR
jgi:sensor histidine kinase YesM